MARRRREEPDDLEPQPPADPIAVAREIVLRQLTMRARSEAELRTALRRRNVPDEVADEVLGRFSELGLVDDAAFAAQWVEGQQRRLRSRQVLRQELRTKGVDADVAAEALAAVTPEDEDAAALALARKRAAATRGLDRDTRYRRMIGALARRGFSSAVSHSAVREALAEEGEPASEGVGPEPEPELGT